MQASAAFRASSRRDELIVLLCQGRSSESSSSREADDGLGEKRTAVLFKRGECPGSDA